MENYDEQAKERRREEEEAAVSSNNSDDFEQDEPITSREPAREKWKLKKIQEQQW